MSALLLLFTAVSTTWTAASYVDGEYARGTFTAATLPTLTPTVTTGPTTANVSWTPTQWSGSTYTLTHATDSSGTGAATAYSGTSSSTTDNGEFATASPVLSHATAVSTAQGYTCALTEAGVYCWGVNGYGQTGVPTTIPTVTNPTRVSGLPGVPTAISTGDRHACAIVAGAVWCWGSNSSGQLGNTSVSGNTSTPVAVSGMSGKTVTAISAGYQSTCAIASQNAYCWGGNAYGEVGNGTTTKVTTATQISLGGGRVDAINTSNDYVAASPSATTCAAVAVAARCWGTGSSGQLGNGGTTSSSSPVAVTSTGVLSGRTVTGVTTSATHACATTDTIVTCWGNNAYGQLGNGTTTSSSVPVTVSSITGVPAGVLSASVGYSCAVVSSAAWCWGGSSAPLGTGASSNQTTPVQVTSTGALLGVSVTTINAASDHACVVGSTGTTSAAVYCWGANSYAQLGTGAVSPASSAAAVKATALTVTGCANGADYLSDGNCSLAPYTTYYWKLQNQLGAWNSPASGWVAAKTTQRAAINPTATTTAGSATLSWNSYSTTGQQMARYVLQRSDSSDGSGPTTVYDGGALSSTDTGGVPPENIGITALTNGDQHSCALGITGTAYCWGNNAYGQLGNGNTTSATSYTAVSVLTNITSISAGAGFTCAVAAGKAYCWGYNDVGQLGNGTTSTSATTAAQAVSGISGTVTAVAAAWSTACALTSAGTVYCWGEGSTGQLGNGAGADSKTAVQASPGVTTATAISVGRENVCALLSDGSLSCWGASNYGQLGTSSTTTATKPTPVSGLSAVTSVAVGYDFTCVISGGNVKCLGINSYGQLGNGTTTNTSTPVTVQRSSDSTALSGATRIAAGYGYACAAASGSSSKGTGYCWGNDNTGQLGDAATGTQYKAVPISTSTGIPANAVLKRISVYGSSYATRAASCAADGTKVYCWGYNAQGQVGNGNTTSPQTSPVYTGLSIVGTPSCPTGSSLISALTCSLVASTTYYYQLTYYLGAWTGPSSGWVAVTTSAS